MWLVVLALGIGANAAIFSVVNSVLLRPLPFKDAGRLVLLSSNRSNQPGVALPFSLPDFFDVRDQARVYEAVGSWAFGRGNLSAAQPEHVQFAVTSANFFSILGVAPETGRLFLDDDDRAGAAHVVVVSHGLRQRLNSATLTLDGHTYDVVGVLPASFRFLNVQRDTDVWLPLGSDPFVDRRYARGVHSAGVLGRLKPDGGLADAQTEANAIAARLAQRYPDDRGRGIVVMSLREQVVKQLRPAILVLLGAVGFVLLIACANVASLLLARATARRREMAIRAALGAGRRRLVQQLLTEHIVLAIAGGALGLLVATWGVDLLVTLPAGSPNLFVPYAIERDQIHVDRIVVLFTMAISLAAAVVFGLKPALDASRLDLNDSLKDGGQTAAGHRTSRTRVTLVVAEVALSTMLLVGAGLLLRTFVQLRHVDLGFQPENVLSFEVSLPPSTYGAPAQTRAFFDALLGRLKARGGGVAAGAAEYLPFSGADSATGLFVDGRPAPAPGEDVQAHYRSVTAAYFDAMKIPVLAGRGLTDRDGADAPRVVVINETMARRYWPNADPIGQRMAITIEALRFRPAGPPALDVRAAMRETVGVVADVKHAGVQTDVFAEAYLPFAQRPSRAMTVVVRTTGDPLALAGDARRAAMALDPNQPISNISAVSDLVAASIAQPRDIVALLTRHGMALAASGLAIGLAGALALGRVMSGLLFGVTPADPITLAGTAVVVGAVAWAACYIPARRAMRIDPIAALRNQ